MAQTFKKSITKLDTVTSYDGKTDVVFNVGWYYIIQDDSNDTQSQLFYETELNIDSIGSFKDYSSLTESDIITWIEASLTTDQDTKIKTNLTGMINRKKGGLDFDKELPWS
tara:strand:+ start:219 stop:551 length:333 start_codon:yes stop_codon:yes gene_type:complete